MSILIKGITLEDFIRCGGEYAEYLDGTGRTVELPDHGDLIDMDALPKYTGYALSANDVANAVINANAVIPAERGEE